MHYANGREAKVGDLVVGTAYNTPAYVVPYGSSERAPPKRLVGTLVKATPGSDRCNAEIEWTEVVSLSDVAAFRRPGMAQGDPRIVHGQAHFTCRDYTHCGALLHIEDVVGIERGADGHYTPHPGWAQPNEKIGTGG